MQLEHNPVALLQANRPFISVPAVRGALFVPSTCFVCGRRIKAMDQSTTTCLTAADGELVRRISGGDSDEIVALMARSNRRLFRVAWSILKHREDAEDALQNAYLRAFAAIETFKGTASVETWLTRIVINEALMRRRSIRRSMSHLLKDPLGVAARYRESMMLGSAGPAPDDELSREQTLVHLEAALTKLPEKFRLVFVLREVEELAVAQVATMLELPQSTVKTRHFRARKMLRRLLPVGYDELLPQALPFAGADCTRLTARVSAIHVSRCRDRMPH